MQNFEDVDLGRSAPEEKKKRKKELLLVFFITLCFGLLTWFEIRLFATAQQLPFVHSIFFFGLVNFNIILLLLLVFMIFRNVVKVFVERRGRIFGSSLKAKLVAAFVSFSSIPTVLMFIISVFYINSSFDKWFSAKMINVLKSSIEVTNAYYFNAKKKNYHFAHEVAEQIKSKIGTSQNLTIELEKLRASYSLDAVEYYPSLFGKRSMATSTDESLDQVPPVSLEFLQKGLGSKAEASIIHQFGDGNLVRVIVPVSSRGASRGAIVVSSFLPVTLTSKMNDISSAYEEFRDINPLEYPLKSIYLIILVLMTFVILLAASWFGFYLAKQLAIPLVQLGRATKRISQGDYSKLDIRSGSEEIHSLITSFNSMSTTLEDSRKQLDEHARYIDTVLKNVSAGVISVDKHGFVTTINQHAAALLKIDPNQFIGRRVRDLLTTEYFRTFAELLKNMNDHQIESIQRELRITVQGEAIPLQLNLSILKNEQGEEVGKVIVFDDMTPIVSAQRAAAWTEVARRIAHEIKNPLTPIRLSAERLQRKFGAQISDPAFAECTTMIVQQVEDLKNLVNEFSNFARLPQAKPVMAQLHEVLEDSLKLYKQAHPNVEFDTQLDKNLPEFKFDPNQLKRVFVNLVDNAIAAMEKTENPVVTINTQFSEDLNVLNLQISDNGPGIPAKDRARIFEPYYSTKPTGTGLGLSIVRRIIEDHNGFIRVQNNEPHGVRFVIEMPLQMGTDWQPAKRGEA